MPKPQGFSDTGTPTRRAAFTFASGVSAPSRSSRRSEPAGSRSRARRALPRTNGFDSTGQAAAEVLECMTLLDAFYDSFTGAELTRSKATEVDGPPGWEMDAEIRIDDPTLKVQGDVAKVVVVDTGDLRRYGLFVSVVPIGDQALLDQQQGLVDDLQVD